MDSRCSIDDLTATADEELRHIDPLVRGAWARPITWRQPVHTLYMPVDKFFSAVDNGAGVADFASSASQQALNTMAAVPLESLFTDATSRVLTLTKQKLETQPIEDLRIDLEDGFTQRAVPEDEKDADEDRYAIRAGEVLAEWALDRGAARAEGKETTTAYGDVSRGEEATKTLAPPFAGIRFKSFDPRTRSRGIKTLVLVLDELNERGVLKRLYDPHSEYYNPRALRLTFPKVQSFHQVTALVKILQNLEKRYGLSEETRIHFEVQIEAPQAILGGEGHAEPMRILQAAEGRCLALHYGTYDYSASLGVDAAHQSMEHPVADHAKDVLQVACSSLGVELSDGSTNRIPTGTESDIRAGWDLHHRLVTRHLTRGIRQGWDLHPAQLVTRHLATISYFRAQWKETAERLRDYIAGDESRWMDEPATAKAMSGYLRRAYQAGAVTAVELHSFHLDLPVLESLQHTGRP